MITPEARRVRRRLFFALLAALGASVWSGTGYAFDMWVKIVVGPKHDCVHERILLAAQACVDKEMCEPATRACDDPDWGGLRDGVRWNDDPLRLLNNGRTYVYSGAYFTHGQRVSVKDPTKIGITWNTHYRSHYGDMQFLHAMASRPDAETTATLKRIEMWSEFVYRAGTGDIDLSTPVTAVPVEGIPEIFAGKRWTVRSLLTLRCVSLSRCYEEQRSDERVRQTAIGSLLHLVQDSFSQSHAERVLNACGFGGVRKFFYYPGQEPKVHAQSDRAQPWMAKPVPRNCLNPVTASARVLELAGFGEVKTPQPWSVAREYLLDTVFKLEQ